MAKVHGESKLTFLESTSIIIGHGVGSGILSVPFLASRNNWHDIIWIAAVAYCMNLLLHFMIAELSLNNNGAQFIKCFENELCTDVPAGTSKFVDIPFRCPAESGEYRYQVSLCLKKDVIWAPKGYVIATAETKISNLYERLENENQ